MENAQSLTLETLTLKTKINSAIESIGHINTSIVPNFIHDILRDIWKFFTVWHCPRQPEGLDQSRQEVCHLESELQFLAIEGIPNFFLTPA